VHTTDIPAQRRPPEPFAVAEGRWSFELRGEELADLRYDGVPLLRAVRPVVRDEDWRTLGATVVERRVERRSAGWAARLDVDFRSGPSSGPADRSAVAYAAQLLLVVDGSQLAVTLSGTARSAFRRNRIGLVLLHSLTEAGRPVEALHTDGSVEQAVWPTVISPHQPLRDLRGLRWGRDDVEVEVGFEGDVFETEDQRNWTDASFKTYSTPLAVPFPVAVRPGDAVVQRVRLRAGRVRTASQRSGGRASTHAARTSNPASTDQAASVLVLDEVRAAVPALSLGATTSGDRVPSWADGTSAFEAVLVELTGPVQGWPQALARADREARALGALLDVRIVAAGPADVGSALALLDPSRVLRLGVFDEAAHVTTQPLWDALAAGCGDRGLGVGSGLTLVAGARSHFAELNRRHDDGPADAPALTCSICPQMHATELPHIIDSLLGQEAVRRDTLRLSRGRPVHLGPVTLRQRFNAVATSGERRAEPPDPLQPTGFTAAWTLGSVAALSAAGVDSLCYYEVTGPGGVGDGARLHPVGRLLAVLAGLTGCAVLAARAPTGVAAYPVLTSDGVRVLLGRLGGSRRQVVVEGPDRNRVPVLLEPWSTVDVLVRAREDDR
jgi:D-apionolactonase